MSEEEMGKIFDPFFTTKTIGRGLGLAVSMGIVRSWDGMIFVKSVLREGSCFSVLLPLVEGVVPDQSEILTEHGNIKTAGTVLLVDDDAILLEIMEHVLQNLGFKVFVADSGKEAVVLLQKHQDIIDYLITDLSMPDMDGWETLAALRKIRPDLPAVLSSGYDETQAMSGDHDESFQGFLHKPYTKADLNNVLGRILGKLSKNA
jgi:CheY-like chemotaxis protein